MGYHRETVPGELARSKLNQKDDGFSEKVP